MPKEKKGVIMRSILNYLPLLAVLGLSFILLKSDVSYVLVWWFCLFFIGLIFFPFVQQIFSGFFDRGYLFSKTIGVALSSYIIWLLSSLRVLPFSSDAIFITLGFLAVFIFIIFKGSRCLSSAIKEKKTRTIFIYEETLFLLGLVFWSFLRGLKPELSGNGGLEKFMDYGFINTILHTKYMPPSDIWFAGKSINYYYFGHYVTAFLTKMSGIKSSVTYNLMMATLFSFSFTLCLSLVSNLILFWKKDSLKKAIIGALISAFLLSMGGNLHTIFFTTIFPAVKSMVQSLDPKIKISDSYWFPDATRFIGYNPETIAPLEDKTIHEFPLYSFVVSDLHAHVINTMFVLTVLALITALINKSAARINKGIPRTCSSFASGNKTNTKNYSTGKKLLISAANYLKILFCLGIFPHIFLITLFIGIFQITNYWDFPIYLVVACAAFFYVNILLKQSEIKVFNPFSIYGITACILSAVLLCICLIFHFPLYLSLICALVCYILLMLISIGFTALFSTLVFGGCVLLASTLAALPFSSRLTPITNGIGFTHTHSLFWQLLIIWGYQLFLIVSFLVFILVIEKKQRSQILLKKGDFKLELIKNILLNKPVDFFIFILGLCSIGLLITPEIIYIKDIYVGGFYRSNTMFKLTYQAFIMFAVISGYITIRIFSQKSVNYKHNIFKALIIILLASPMIYPYYAIRDWYGNSGVISLNAYKGLDGSIYLKNNYPDDYKAAQWLKDNVTSQPTILEANGDSYTDYGRISVETGLPTLQGWWTHEWLWRNDSAIVTSRVKDVQTVYESVDTLATVNILKKYNIKYIIIGKLEKEKFKNIREDKLLSLGKIVFEFNSIKILKVN